MKRTLSILLLLTLVFTLAACGTTPPPIPEPVPSPTPEADTIRIASLKGPTSMGLATLYHQADDKDLSYTLEYSLAGAADELTPKLLNGELDMAAVPANLAATLFNKSHTEDFCLSVGVVNTLGVLYLLARPTENSTSLEDLKGRTIYTTGKGTTPEFALRTLLQAHGLDPDTDVTMEFAAEASEAAALFLQTNDARAMVMLPQPYATSMLASEEGVRQALSLSELWDETFPDSHLITGVLVVNRTFAENNPDLMRRFLEDYEFSIRQTQEDPKTVSTYIEQYGIVEKQLWLRRHCLCATSPSSPERK